MLFQSLRSRILLLVASIVLTTTSVLIFLVKNEIEDAIFSAQKNNARNVLNTVLLTVENQYQSIIFHKESILQRRKNELKNIIQIETDELNSIYNEFAEGYISEKRAKEKAIMKMKRIRYDDGVGYIWINDTERPIPNMIMHPTIPELNGIILDDPVFNTALGSSENLFKAVVDICLEKGEGYVDYLWPKPTESDLTFYQPKVSYVSLFKPWNWIIGTGVYIDDIELEAERRIDAVINELEESLSKVTIGKTGYVFIFRGDKTIVIHPTIERNMDVSGLINTASGNPIFDDLIVSSKKSDGELRYLWDSPDHRGEYVYWKRSFTEHFEPLDWYIGSSVYEIEIEAPAKELILKVLLFSIIILILAFLLSFILSQSLIKPVKMLSLSVSDIEKNGIENVNVPIFGTTETKNLGMVISGTLKSLHESEIKLEKYQNHLEEEVRKRTGEVEQSNKKLIEAKEAAEASNIAKSTFLANMSHEIRTPMNAILGFAEILSDEEYDPEKAKYISNIRTSGRTLLSLINDILDISKVESGKLELQNTPVSIKALINDMKIIFNKRVVGKKLDLVFIGPPEDPADLIVDEMRLRQIMINLIGNAVKFTDQGIVEIRTSYIFPEKKKPDTVNLLLSIKDSGIGIAKDQLERIFNPFEQQDGQKMSLYGGTGLGLAITKRLLDKMNGEIKVESEQGKGSLFTVLLKNVEIASIEKPEEADPEILDPDSIIFQKKTILIVDDIDFNRELIIGYLSKYGFSFLEAKDGLESLELIRKNKPDLILMDMKMPIMNGYEAVAILKEDKELQNIPIIAVTASAMISDEKNITKLCSSILKKPVNKNELLQKIMNFVPYITTSEEKSEVEVEMIYPPNEILKELIDSAIIGDIEGIEDQILRIDKMNPAYGNFCSKLRQSVSLYDIDTILEFINKQKG